MNENEKAIQLFKSQIQELAVLKHYDVSAWKAFTIEIIKRYLGKDTSFLNPYTRVSLLNQKYEFETDSAICKKNLEKCIQYIEAHGILKFNMPAESHTVSPAALPLKSNFISRMSEGWATVWVTVILPTIFGIGLSIGTYMTQNKIDQQKVELSNDNQELKHKIEKQTADLERLNKQIFSQDVTDTDSSIVKNRNESVKQRESSINEHSTAKSDIYSSRADINSQLANSRSGKDDPTSKSNIVDVSKTKTEEFLVPFNSTESVTIDRKNWVSVADQKDLNKLWFIISGSEYSLKPGKAVTITNQEGKICSILYVGITKDDRFKFRLICD